VINYDQHTAIYLLVESMSGSFTLHIQEKGYFGYVRLVNLIDWGSVIGKTTKIHCLLGGIAIAYHIIIL
jgi:hypothetical protein